MIVNKFSSGAAGILPYTVHNSKIYFLLGFERRGYSDFGGYKDSVHELTSVAASREFSEETLGLFCKTIESRGTIEGVIESTYLFNKLLSNQDLHSVGVIKKVYNKYNQYEMFICPVDRFITSDEFKYSYDCNRNTNASERIDNTEKRSVWWFDIDTLINAIENNDDQFKSRGRIYQLYGSFFKTLKDPLTLEFIKSLKTSFDKQLLKTMIYDIFNSPELLVFDKDLDLPQHQKQYQNQQDNQQQTNFTTTVPVQSNIKQIQESLFNNSLNNKDK